MILVIGATGFVGMYTVDKLLSDGKKVVATGRNKKLGERLQQMGATFIPLDITDSSELRCLLDCCRPMLPPTSTARIMLLTILR